MESSSSSRLIDWSLISTSTTQLLWACLLKHVTVFPFHHPLVSPFSLSLCPGGFGGKERGKCQRRWRKQDASEDIDNEAFVLTQSLL